MVRALIVSALVSPALALAQAPCPSLGPGQIGLGQYCKEGTPALASATPGPTLPKQPEAGAKSASVPDQATQTTPTAAPKKTWRIEPTDGRLANTFDRWARSEGMRAVWNARQHVYLSAGDSFEGTLQEALRRALLSPSIKYTYPLEVCFYSNNPTVIRVTEEGEQKGCTP